MKKVVVTGSNGFIGRHLVKRLRSMASEVIVVDLEDDFDITDCICVSELPSFDVMVHLAARSFVPHSYENPKDFYQTNVMGTLNMLELCRKNNAQFIYTSSYVYGTPYYLPIDENHPVRAFNPYSQTKIIGEELCRAYFRDFNVSSLIFRPFNVYGKGQGKNFLIQTILNQAENGIIKLKDPRSKRDFIYIDDLVEAYVKAILSDNNGINICNLGSGESTSIHELTSIISENYDTKLSVEFSNEYRSSEILETRANIDFARELLDWAPNISINEGIKMIIDNEH